MQPWTYTSKFSRMNMDFVCVCVCVCVCVKFNYLTMDYPLPLHKSIIGHFVLHACLCDLLPNGGSLDNRGRPWLVCVHGYTVIFLMGVHG